MSDKKRIIDCAYEQAGDDPRPFTLLGESPDGEMCFLGGATGKVFLYQPNDVAAIEESHWLGMGDVSIPDHHINAGEEALRIFPLGGRVVNVPSTTCTTVVLVSTDLQQEERVELKLYSSSGKRYEIICGYGRNTKTWAVMGSVRINVKSVDPRMPKIRLHVAGVYAERLREEKKILLAQQRALIDKVETEQRRFTVDEDRQFEDIQARVTALQRTLMS